MTPKRVWSKLTSKPMYYLERKRTYPLIRARARNLPSVTTAAQGATVLAVLTTPGQYLNAIWTAWSWSRFLGTDCRLKIFVDGVLTERGAEDIRRVFPQVEIVTVSALLETFPASDLFLRFAKANPCGHKLAIVLSESETGSVIYSDDDVLAFNDPAEVREAMARGGVPRYFVDGSSAYHPELVKRLRENGVQINERVNAGWLYVPKQTLSLPLAEKVLTPWLRDYERKFCFEAALCEQTCTAGLLTKAGGEPLPAARYVISGKRAFYLDRDLDYGNVAARHFVRGVRHVMYLKGLPILWKQARGKMA